MIEHTISILVIVQSDKVLGQQWLCSVGVWSGRDTHDIITYLSGDRASPVLLKVGYDVYKVKGYPLKCTQGMFKWLQRQTEVVLYIIDALCIHISLPATVEWQFSEG